MPTTQTTVRQQSRTMPAVPGTNSRKKLRANSGDDQKHRGERHPDEKLYLVMKQAAVVEESDDREQRGAGENADDLLHAARRGA